MDPSNVRKTSVIYVTTVMTVAIRALTIFLSLWLTAATAFPPCCWSMGDAHEHQQAPDIAQSHAASNEHHHDHHGGDDPNPDVVGTAVPAPSMIPSYDCDATLADTAMTAGVVTRAVLRPTGTDASASVVPTVSAHEVAGSDTSPPGAAVNSAFLSPLRI